MNRSTSTIAGLLLAGLSVFAAAGSVAAALAQTTASPAAPAPKIDAAAMKILEKSQNKMFGLKTFRAECWETVKYAATTGGKARPNRYEMARLIAAKPNRMRYDKWGMTVPSPSSPYSAWKRQKAAPTYTFVSDGKTVYKQFGTSYDKAAQTGPQYMYTILEPWDGFYTTNSSPFSSMQFNRTQKNLLELRLDAPQTVDGIVCDVVYSRVASEYDGETITEEARLFVGRDGIVRRKSSNIKPGSKPRFTRDAVIRNIVTNAPVKTPKTTFAYVPPAGVKARQEVQAAEPALLAAGTPAPDFSATDVSGAAVKLSDLRGKVVVVDFWASWCPPCVASMPHNQKVIQKLQAEGLPVVLLAVDNSEGRDAFAGWVKKHPEFDALRFVYADPEQSDISGKLYRVSGIPTQYVVDAEGMVRSSSVGFGGESDEMEKAIRAALAARVTAKTD